MPERPCAMPPGPGTDDPAVTEAFRRCCPRLVRIRNGALWVPFRGETVAGVVVVGRVQAASTAAGVRRSRASWSRDVFHQWTRSIVASPTSFTDSPIRWEEIDSALQRPR